MRLMRPTCLFLILVAGLFSGRGTAQDDTGDRPDLTGVWTNYDGGAGEDDEDDGRPALRPEAQAKVDAYQALIDPTGDTPGGFCLGYGMPGSMLRSGGYPMEIIQRTDQITIIYEAHNEIRRVYFGDRVIPPADRLPERNGYSIGRWEGNTLIVETTHLKEQVDERYPHSADAHIEERYTLSTDDTGARVLIAEMTMTDPAFHTQPYTQTKRWSEVPNGFLMTYECNEPAWLEHLNDLAEATGGGEH